MATDPQEPVDSAPAVEAERSEDCGEQTEIHKEIGEGARMGSGNEEEGVRIKESEWFTSLSRHTSDYESFEEFGGSGKDQGVEGGQVEKDVEKPRSRVKHIAHRLSKKDVVRPYPES